MSFLITTPLWGNVSNLGLRDCFLDQGRGWGTEMDIDEAKDRRNVGLGFAGGDATSLIQIPSSLLLIR